jgi:hypothetical protein
MVDYTDETFSSVEMIANGKGLSLSCHYGYYLIRDGQSIYWSYFLRDILDFLRNYNA